MAFTRVVLAGALLLVNSAFGFNHLCVDEHWAAGIHPHPTDCTKFIECTNGIAYEMYCPAGLKFNTVIKSCDNPNNFVCTVKTTETPVTTTQARISTGKFDHYCADHQWATSTLHPHPTECHKFIECANGIGYEMVCPVDLAYNPAKLYCDDPVKLNCLTYVTSKPGPTAAPGVSTTVSFLHFCVDHVWGTSTLHAHPYLCHKYIECSNGLAYVMDCPAGLAFNDAIDTCDDAGKVNCGTAITTPKPTTGISGDVNDICRDQNLPNGPHAHPFECHKYIECSNKLTTVTDCPIGQVYNENLKTCQLVAVAPYCKTSIVGGKTTASPTINEVTVCADYNLAPGIHPHPYRCDRFIECSNGQSYTLACPDGLHYHIVEKTCDDPHKVDCQDNYDFFKKLTIG